MKLRNKYTHLIPLIVFLTFACNLPHLYSPSVASTEIPGLATLIGDPDAATTTPSITPLPALVTQPPQPTQAPVQEGGALHLYDMLAYTTQPGDTLPALAVRFRTSIANIAADNPFLPPENQVTTLTPGQSLSIRLVVEPFWDDQTPIFPNSLYPNGPAQLDFDTRAFLQNTNGWLKSYLDISGESPVAGVEIIDSIVQNYSISPRLILALLEYELHALTDPVVPPSFSLGNSDANRRTLGRQLSWMANILNNGYYGWRKGTQTQFVSPYGAIGQEINPSPWQNAASVALQYYFSRFMTAEAFNLAVSPTGFMQTYQALFGVVDWNSDLEQTFIPGDLRQPALSLPFQAGLRWAYTGGPHSGWGTGSPWAAIDFAPPATVSGCTPSEHWAVAAADGVVARSQGGVVVLDLDGDGKVQTGWAILYLHIHPDGAARVGSWLRKGDLVGHPSCTGGQSTGRNLHLARLYNGEWIAAGGPLAFNLDGWVVVDGETDYKGYMVRDMNTIFPSTVGDWTSQLTADPLP